MTIQYDVKATYLAANATTAVFTGPARIKGIVISYPVGGGAFNIKNGSGGTTVFYFAAPLAEGSINIVIPGDGIRCDNGIYGTTAAGVTATVFYG
jgi:hypothetical protein